MSHNTHDPRLYFQMFNEIGIIEQLTRALFEAQLPAGVLVSHFSVLNHLVRVEDGRTPLELARAFQVPKTTMSHTLSLLTKRGWIDMRANPDDARSKRVWLTDQGRAFRDDAINMLAPHVDRLSGAISPDLVKDLLPKLVSIRQVLDAARDTAAVAR